MLPTEMILKQAILDLVEPVKFQGFQEDIPGSNNPEFLRWGPDKFLEILGHKVLSFRIGGNSRTCEPQWDVRCSIEQMKMSDFIEKTKLTDDPVWRYFDYKYMNQLFEEKRDFLKSIDWKRFGFDKNGNDSTLWIGSKGAHTNCHRDSYGCNLVAQIHGSKQWLLFPPDTGNAMKPTRVPYEESTVYSKFNFFSPTTNDEEAIMKIDKNARLVVLDPGDVLLVPNGWWHYVESLDFSISMNVWLPVDGDYKERVNEALVKLLVSNIGERLPFVPEYEPEYTHEGAIILIKTCVDEYKKHSESRSIVSSAAKKFRMTPWTAQELAKKYPNSVKLLPELSREKLRKLLINNRERFPEIETAQPNRDETLAASIDIVNALCNYEIMNKVSDLLLDFK